MTKYEQVKQELKNSPKTWLITGVAGFIGSPKMNFIEGELLETGTETSRVKLADGSEVSACVDTSKAKAGDKVMLGIRPEHLVPPGHGHAENQVSGTVLVTEHLGAESFVYMDVQGNDFTVKTVSDVEAKPDDSFEVGFPARACYLFGADDLAFPRTARYTSGE